MKVERMAISGQIFLHTSILSKFFSLPGLFIAFSMRGWACWNRNIQIRKNFSFPTSSQPIHLRKDTDKHNAALPKLQAWQALRKAH